MTKEDLASLRSQMERPNRRSCTKGIKLFPCLPHLAAGSVLAQILKSIEPFDVEQYPHNSTQYIQVITEAERRAYADRSYFLGDPDFVTYTHGQPDI